jgi:hypothetical protein
MPPDKPIVNRSEPKRKPTNSRFGAKHLKIDFRPALTTMPHEQRTVHTQNFHPCRLESGLGHPQLFCLSILGSIPAVICGHMALSRIKRSDGALTGQGLAIGGLVTGYIGIVLAVVMIPLMLAIAIPNFVKARQTAQTHSCINHLVQIDGAKNQWAQDKHKQPTDIPTESDLAPYLTGGQLPKCLAGGQYKINSVGEKPTCSVPGHQLE